jgi:hypothetical protein
MSLGKDFPTFQRIRVPSYSGFQAVCAEGIQCIHLWVSCYSLLGLEDKPTKILGKIRTTCAVTHSITSKMTELHGYFNC